jgi:hypothetical protein
MRPSPATVLVIAVILLAGCGSGVPSPSTVTTFQPTPTAQPTQLSLPAHVAGVPGPDDPSTVITPQTPRGELEVGVERNLMLGHCGLLSPIDMDGSLWDPIGGHDRNGGPLTEHQLGELINATSVVVVLTDHNAAELRTPFGALITLARHEGPRPFFLCD